MAPWIGPAGSPPVSSAKHRIWSLYLRNGLLAFADSIAHPAFFACATLDCRLLCCAAGGERTAQQQIPPNLTIRHTNSARIATGSPGRRHEKVVCAFSARWRISAATFFGYRVVTRSTVGSASEQRFGHLGHAALHERPTEARLLRQLLEILRRDLLFGGVFLADLHRHLAAQVGIVDRADNS